MTLPERAPKRTLLRLRLPDGRRIVSASADDRTFRLLSDNAIELSEATGTVRLIARVAP